jgi:nitrous oxidase accessory protein
MNSIAQALAQAQDGDTLFLKGPAVFHEHVVLAKSVRLLGTNSPVSKPMATAPLWKSRLPIARVQGLVIRNSGRDLSAFDSGIMIMAPRTTIRDCCLEVDAFGIYLRGASECVLEAKTPSREAPMSPRPLAATESISGKPGTTGSVANTIHDKRDGMYFSFADDNLIGGNRVWDTRFGIHYMYSHQNRLLTNFLHAMPSAQP